MRDILVGFGLQDTINYALGLSHGAYRDLPTVGHGGSDAGYRSQFLRFPEQETPDDWSQGLPLAYAREVRDYWLNEYDLMYTVPEGGMLAGVCFLIIFWQQRAMKKRD